MTAKDVADLIVIIFMTLFSAVTIGLVILQIKEARKHDE